LIIGLVAGAGSLPVIAGREIISQGHELVCVAIDKKAADSIRTITDKVTVVAPTKIGKAVETLKNYNAEGVLFIGKVDKSHYLKFMKYDMTAVRLAKKAVTGQDDHIMSIIGDEFERNGIRVLKQTDFLNSLLVPEGVLSKRYPDDEDMGDIKFGFKMAKAVGALDIGQTVVVKKKAVMAVEAIEGTDIAIERGLALAKGEGLVVKIYRPTQDERFDIPAIGMQTLENIVKNKGKGLVFEAEKTFVIDIEECIRYSDRKGILLISYKGQGNES